MKVEYDVSRPAQVTSADGVATTAGQRIRTITLDDGTKIVENGAVVAGAPAINIATDADGHTTSTTVGSSSLTPSFHPNRRTGSGPGAARAGRSTTRRAERGLRPARPPARPRS